MNRKKTRSDHFFEDLKRMSMIKGENTYGKKDGRLEENA